MSVSLETLEKLKSQLQKVKDLGTPIKADLYTHLTEVFNRIMLHHPADAYDKFEEISGLVKHNNFKIKDPDHDYDVNGKAGVIQNKEMLDFIEKMINLLNENPDLLSKVDRGMVAKELKCSIPNFLEQAEMLEWAGIGFGENFNFMIQKSIKRLAKISGAKSLQLFGKVLGTQQDYWVAQGVLTEAEEVPSNKLQELRGKGVNSSVFWVTHNLMGDWIQLPDAEPEHIMGARMMKKMLTGNLNASIDSCPPFLGKERNLLRAQIARIQHNCQICPKGMYEMDEDSGEQKFAEEAPPTSTDDLKNLENWSHAFPIVLKVGRCSHTEPVGMEDDAK